MNIVLMHGVLGFNRLGPINYFNDVAHHLRQRFPGTKVLTTTVLSVGTIETRAAEAARMIAHPPPDMPLDPEKPIHILAHSMGGLDARLLIHKDLEGLRARIRTLICLGTPHLGSPVASLLNLLNPFEVLPLAKRDTSFIEELKTKTNAVHDLAETSGEAFNRACPDASSVHYFDVAGVGRTNALFHTSAPFLPTFGLLTFACGANDGVVPFTSATRRRTPAAVWPADHADLVGHDLDRGATGRPAFDYLAAYDALIQKCILLNQ
jgi:triacylglycerol lipase